MTTTIPPYTPATQKQLAEMNDEQLLTQYQSLADLLKATRGLPFERNPSHRGEDLARLIWEGQTNCFKDVLVGSLVKWGENHPGPVLYAGGTQ